MNRLRWRPAAKLVVSLGLAGFVLAACASGGGQGSGSTTSTSTPQSTTTSAPPTTTTTGGTTTSAAAASTCQPSQVQVTPGMSSGAAGTIELVVTIADTSSQPCTLEGYPGMQLYNSAGQPIPTTVVRGMATFLTPAANQPPTLQTLGPSKTASFSLQYEDVPVGNETSCPTSATADITPPNDTSTVSLALEIAPCNNGTVHVSPVYSSTGG